MSGLLIQIFIITLLPLSFLGLAGYTWRHQARRRLARWWCFALLSLAIWASYLLSPYLAFQPDNTPIGYNWHFIGNYALSLSGGFVLYTTIIYLARSYDRKHRYFGLASLFLWLLALSTDPLIWHNWQIEWATLETAGITLTHQQIWQGLWMVSWFFPMLWAWFRIERANHSRPSSLYRNQVIYWFVTISLILFGGVLAFQQAHINVQQIGAILLLVAAVIGTAGVSHTHLPDLPATLRLVLFRIGRAGLIFVMIWVGLLLLNQQALGWQEKIANTPLITTAALLAFGTLAALVVFDRMVQNYTTLTTHPEALAIQKQLEVNASLMSITDFSETVWSWLNTKIELQTGFFFVVTDTPGGGVICRPVWPHKQLPPLLLRPGTALVEYFRLNQTPLTITDLTSLSLFNDITPEEQAVLEEWQQSVIVPLHAHNRLIGLLTIGSKKNEEQFIPKDINLIEAVAVQIAPLFAHVYELHLIRKVSDHAFAQNQNLGQESRRLRELVNLYSQFTHLLTPELRQPLTALESQLTQLQPAEQNGTTGSMDKVREQMGEAQAMVDNLIAVASRLDKQTEFKFAPVFIDSILRSALKNLQTMAQARKTEVNLEIRGSLLPVYGDAPHLTEAVQQLLHNALKFNKIGRKIHIVAEMERNEVRIQIVDEGVGIPPNRMGSLWSGLAKPFDTPKTGSRRRTRVGLPLVKFIVQAHGGRVAAESTYGKGSTFTLYLPALLEQPTAD